MPSQTLTLELPEALYRLLKQRADNTRRSVEEESLQLLSASMPVHDLPDELAKLVESLQSLDEPTLWKLGRGRLPAEASAELASLNAKQRRENLNAAEAERLAELLGQYERHMLIRAHAAVLLKRRGHDVASLLGS